MSKYFKTRDPWVLMYPEVSQRTKAFEQVNFHREAIKQVKASLGANCTYLTHEIYTSPEVKSTIKDHKKELAVLKNTVKTLLGDKKILEAMGNPTKGVDKELKHVENLIIEHQAIDLPTPKFGFRAYLVVKGKRKIITVSEGVPNVQDLKAEDYKKLKVALDEQLRS